MKTTLEHLLSARKELVEKLSALRKELEIVKLDIDALDRIIQRYQGKGELSITFDFAVRGNKYLGKTLRESINDVLKRSYPSSMKVATIQKQLLDGGYQTISKNFDSAIFGMISQMIKNNEVEKLDKGLYKSKCEF